MIEEEENGLLTKSIADVLDDALSNGTPIIVSYVDANARPHVSFRGSLYSYDANTLALWSRTKDRGLPLSLPSNPALALLYRDAAARTTIEIAGHGRVVDDAETNEAIYTGIVEAERSRDPEKLGVGILIELESLRGVLGGERFARPGAPD